MGATNAKLKANAKTEQEPEKTAAEKKMEAAKMLYYSNLQTLAVAHTLRSANPDVDTALADKSALVDPQVRQLCCHFDIEDRLMYWLNSTLAKREETFVRDIEEVWVRLEHAKDPA